MSSFTRRLIVEGEKGTPILSWRLRQNETKTWEHTMARKSIEQRVATLESQIEEIRDQLDDGNGTKDWRRTIGAFTGDDEMLQLLRDAMKLREADRKAVRKKKPKAN